MQTEKSVTAGARTHSRQDYMEHKVSHREYYAQFVTPGIKRMVLNRFGIERLLKSKDEHFNDIPLKDWDRLAGVTDWMWQSGTGRPNHTLHVEDGSLASAVCALKEAAKQIVEENR